MADAMLNPSYRESTLPPLPLPAALPSVGSFAPLTPAPSSEASAGGGGGGGSNGGGGGGGGVAEPEQPGPPVHPHPPPPPEAIRVTAHHPAGAPRRSPIPPPAAAPPPQPQQRHAHSPVPPARAMAVHRPAAQGPRQGRSPVPPPSSAPAEAPPPQQPQPQPQHEHQHQQPPQHQHQHQQPPQPQQTSPYLGPQQHEHSPYASPYGSPYASPYLGPREHEPHPHPGGGGGGRGQQPHPPRGGHVHPPPHGAPEHRDGGNAAAPGPAPPAPAPAPENGHGHHRHHRHSGGGRHEEKHQRDQDPSSSNKPPVEKTVVINLPPEAAERAREHLDRHARAEEAALVVRGINLSVSPSDRSRSLQRALASFDHSDPAVHDEEIAAGADAALTKHLALLALKKRINDARKQSEEDARKEGGGGGATRAEGDVGGDVVGGGPGGGVSPRPSPHSSPHLGPMSLGADYSRCGGGSSSCEELCDELTNVCEAFEMIYRCSAERVQESYGRVGCELLPLLMGLMEWDIGKRRRAARRAEVLAAAAEAEAAAKAEAERKKKEEEAEKARAEANLKVKPEPSPDDQDLDKPDNDQEHVKKKRKVSEDRTVPVVDSAASAAIPAVAPDPHQEYPQNRDDYVSPTRNRRLRKITKIFGHFARVGALTQPLAYHPGLLSSLRHVVDLPPSSGVPREARLNSLWILANLACNAENMVVMACQPGLLPALVRTARRPTAEEEDSFGDIDRYMEAIRSRSIAVRALLNLSWSPENKLLLSEHAGLVEALTSALMYRASTWGGFGRGVSGTLLQTRRLAAGALRNLAAAPIRNKIRLCRQGTGTAGAGAGGGTLLDRLSDAARHDPDRQVREKASATLHNLACADTAGGFVERPELLEVVADAAAGGGDGDAGNLARRTLRVLERSIAEDMEGYKTLRPVLDRVAAERRSSS